MLEENRIQRLRNGENSGIGEKRNGETSMRRRTLLLLLAVLAIIIVAGAGGWYLFQPKSEENNWILAEDFSLIDLDGNSFSLSDFRGKVVILDFMATWCGSCRQELSHLKDVWENETYKGKLVLVTIDVDLTESAETLRAFRQDFSYATWIWATDTDEEQVAQSYEVGTIPKIVIIDQKGHIRFTYTGETSALTLTQEINQLLG